MSQVTVKGGPVSIGGEFLAIGEMAKDFSLANDKRENVNLASFGSKRKILNIFSFYMFNRSNYPISTHIYLNLIR